LRGGCHFIASIDLRSLAHVISTSSPLPPQRSLVNGEIRQQSKLEMIFDVKALVAFLSRGQTLLRGTVILCGTPAGVGYTQKPNPIFLRGGDTVHVEIERVGRLRASVADEVADCSSQL
jgi:2-keto-4-pentenoate hydratase/2-oxohepta-3-ene-1,7-dioic acid hydratase in catechol pathway